VGGVKNVNPDATKFWADCCLLEVERGPGRVIIVAVSRGPARSKKAEPNENGATN